MGEGPHVRRGGCRRCVREGVGNFVENAVRFLLSARSTSRMLVDNRVENRRASQKSALRPLRPLCDRWYMTGMTDHPVSPWGRDLRRRLRDLRHSRGLSFETVAGMTGMAKSSLLAIEGGESRNLYLDHLVELARAYDVPFLELLLGWKSKRVPTTGFVDVDVEALQDHVRASIRRDRGELGTPSLAEQAKMEQSTLVRWESGEYRRIDLLRLHRLAGALEADLRNWLTVP